MFSFGSRGVRSDDLIQTFGQGIDGLKFVFAISFADGTNRKVNRRQAGGFVDAFAGVAHLLDRLNRVRQNSWHRCQLLQIQNVRNENRPRIKSARSAAVTGSRSEEHTSELQSRFD